MKKVFKNRSNLMKSSRNSLDLEQGDISIELGVTKQFISNCERECCSMPIDMWLNFSCKFSVDKKEIKKAFLLDYEETIALYFG